MTAGIEPDPVPVGVASSGLVIRTVRRDGVCANVVLVGELDASTVGAAGDLLAAVISDGVRQLVVDVARLDFCDAAGMGLFVELNERCCAIGGGFRLRAPPPGLQRLLTIVDLEFLVGEHGTKEGLADGPV